MDASAITNVVGIALAGSLVGAAGLGLIAAITGVNVRREGTPAAVTPDFLLLAKGLSAERLVQAQEAFQQKGIS